jgi:hypothetical protein
MRQARNNGCPCTESFVKLKKGMFADACIAGCCFDAIQAGLSFDSSIYVGKKFHQFQLVASQYLITFAYERY